LRQNPYAVDVGAEHRVLDGKLLWLQLNCPLAWLVQTSDVHGLLSSHALVPTLATQLPPRQPSPTVHGLPSLHTPPSLTATDTQPTDLLQLSAVHALPSSQLMALPLQVPPLQTSFAVHLLPSSQVAVLAAWVQPVVLAQASSVHGLLSSQLTVAGPAHTPPLHTSPAVHGLASLQTAVLFTCAHPVVASQLSLVHALLSSHEIALPAKHLPPLHRSPLVQTEPSSQAPVLLLNAHFELTHTSSVHALLSLQSLAKAQ
jgi:hypothetical protein